MKNNEFRTPLIQSGALLVAIVFIISLIPSGDGMSVGSVIGALFTGVFRIILFLLALSLAVVISITVLVGIFIAAVALQSPERAAEIYTGTKTRVSELIQDLLACRSISTESADTGISQEEYDQMKSTVSSLQSTNVQLQIDISSLQSRNTQLQDDIHGLTRMVDDLKDSETKIKDLISQLSAKVEAEPDSDLKNQIQKLEEMVGKTTENLASLAGRIESLEESATQPATGALSGGIFSYIVKDDDRALFISKIEEGTAKEMTYAQFDEFLTESLPAELDKILKEHPSLTKDYIRSMRK